MRESETELSVSISWNKTVSWLSSLALTFRLSAVGKPVGAMLVGAPVTAIVGELLGAAVPVGLPPLRLGPPAALPSAAITLCICLRFLPPVAGARTSEESSLSVLEVGWTKRGALASTGRSATSATTTLTKAEHIQQVYRARCSVLIPR